MKKITKGQCNAFVNKQQIFVASSTLPLEITGAETEISNGGRGRGTVSGFGGKSSQAPVAGGLRVLPAALENFVTFFCKNHIILGLF